LRPRNLDINSEESLFVLRNTLANMTVMLEFVNHLTFIDRQDMDTCTVPYPEILGDLIRMFDGLLTSPGVENDGATTVEGLHVTFVLIWVKHLETAMDGMRSLITEHEIRALENEAYSTSRKVSKLPGRVIVPSNAPPTRLSSRPVAMPLATPMLAENRSVNTHSNPIQMQEVVSLVNSQQRLKRARNGVERDPNTLSSALHTSNYGTTSSKSTHKAPAELLSDEEASAISDVSDNVSLVTDKSNAKSIQTKASIPKMAVPEAAKARLQNTGGKLHLVRSATTGHDDEPVNFSKDISY